MYRSVEKQIKQENNVKTSEQQLHLLYAIILIIGEINFSFGQIAERLEQMYSGG